MHVDGPSIPFHIAKAYGVPPTKAVARTASLGGQAAETGKAGATPPPADRADVSKIQRLVAGVVPGGIDFVEGGPARASDSAAIPLYRRPGEANAVATNVAQAVTGAGRVLDVEG